MSTADDDPRNGVHIAAGESVLGAAALIYNWLMENADGTAERAQFVLELDQLMCDSEFTSACLQGLRSPGG